MFANGENTRAFTIPEGSMATVIRMRRATTADARDVFEWRNDPQTRLASISQDPIDWDAHAAWFTRSLHDDDRRLYIAEDPDAEQSSGAIGMVRFDLLDGHRTAEVSINLNPGWRGRGRSAETLLAGVAALREEHGAVPELLATIRRENTVSVRLFEGAGFVQALITPEFAYFRREAELGVTAGTP